MRHLTTLECQCISGGISLVPANTSGLIPPYANGIGAGFKGLTVLPDFEFPRLPSLVLGAPIGVVFPNGLTTAAPSLMYGGSEG